MKVTDKNLDEIYDAMDTLQKGGHFYFINKFLILQTPGIWREELDILLAYATTTLACKSKLPDRTRFIDECKRFHYDDELWKGLE
jgi:hypothetical protein